MTEAKFENSYKKATAFFERAEEVASTDNFDYAIDMYLEGIRHAPDALEDGHAALRHMSLIRQGKGGKKPSVIEKARRHGGALPIDKLINAEFLLAKDPDNLAYAEAMLKACVSGSYGRTAEWIARLIFDANRESNKSSVKTYTMLAESYKALEMYSNAVAALQRAIEIKPNDGYLDDMLRDYSARMTVKRGRYGEGGDFRKSIKDRKKQEMLQAQVGSAKDTDARLRIVAEAKKAYDQNPNDSANVLKLAEKLSELGTDKGYAQAIAVLQKAFAEKQDFCFKKVEGEYRIRKIKADTQAAKAALKKTPASEELKKMATGLSAKLLAAELDHYKNCVEHYPTDMKMKYDYGLCLMICKEYDKALPMMQEAQRDPRYNMMAMNKTGLCFLLKGWYDDAIDVFSRAIAKCEIKTSDLGKELRYNLARSYESDGQVQQAMDNYRKLAQSDFGYKDISTRIDKLRAQQ